ncbi:hypothetical protein MNBD_ACTINO01-646 [hydrothermal vent metagenome]|uniref:Uncharacterized protein n=1 Tax=hydrothermal vent metagenome TaxID=652676 RepID=A0A3B0SMC9_9ZZZZ
MPILHTFKQTVLELGRGEAKAKAKPLTVGGESLDRSAAGLDSRYSERAVIFWLLSDTALFLVVGSDDTDHAYRVPYEAMREFHLDYDETVDFLPWYVRITIDTHDTGEITKLEPGHVPGQPLVAPPPVVVEGDEWSRFARGETVPLAGFGAFPKRFRDALTRRMELAGRTVSITGAEAADRSPLVVKRFSRHDSGD